MKKFLVLVIMTLTACATPRTQKPVSIYDFGLQQPATASDAREASGKRRVQASLLVADAAAPAWLDSTGIHYRLAYHDLAQLHVYASNRWAAAPATLLSQRIRSRIARISDDGVMSAVDGARTDYTLRLELEEFTQVFDTIDQSRAIVKLRAGLIDRSTRLLIAQRSFRIEQAAAEPNAAGGVRALTEASDKLIGNLIDWLIEELPKENNQDDLLKNLKR